jgi:hypothetical protein
MTEFGDGPGSGQFILLIAFGQAGRPADGNDELITRHAQKRRFIADGECVCIGLEGFVNQACIRIEYVRRLRTEQIIILQLTIGFDWSAKRPPAPI